MMSDADVELIRKNCCPNCKNFGFHSGPRGGAGQNIYCANPACRAAYNIAPRHNIVVAEHVGTAPEQYYPPRVHILRAGQPLCGFAGYRWLEYGPPPRFEQTFPEDWPVGHSWVGIEAFEDSTCDACRKAARS